MKRVTIVGVGPGDAGLLTRQAQAAIEEADVLFAAQRHAHLAQGRAVFSLKPLSESIERIKEHVNEHNVCVLVSGDPAYYSFTRVLQRRLDGVSVRVLPGIGSVQALFCALGEPYERAFHISLHGRDADAALVAQWVKHHELCAFLTDKKCDPSWVCAALCQYGYGEADVAVGENLSYEYERIMRAKACELLGQRWQENCVMRVINGQAVAEPISPVLKDDDFIRGTVPMTKEEVRQLAVCKLGLTRDAVVWDAGAGTGSVGIQCALLAPYGKTYAIERNPEGLVLIRDNAEKLGAHNVIAVEGKMPQVLHDLPDPTHVFVGGSGGALAGILQIVQNRRAGIRVVITAVTLQTAHAAVQCLQSTGFCQTECIQLQASVQSGRAGILTARNPIFLICGITC